MGTPLKNSLLIAVLVATAAWLGYRATISHGASCSPKPAVIAAMIVLFGALPPLYFGRLLSNGATKQFSIIAWRIAIMLPALVLAMRYVDVERKCYLISLMACYFVALPLESWLLIRDVRRNQASSS